MSSAATLAVARPRDEFRYFPPPVHSPRFDPAFSLSEYGEIAAVAHVLGLTFMPWQRHVIELATAYRLDAFDRRIYRFKYVLITVPRQAGKTTLMTPVRLHRIMTRPGVDAFSTAQTGKDAKKRIMKMIELVQASPLAALFKAVLSNGSEGLVCRNNGSSVTRFSPTLAALHGETPIFVDFDEIWKYPEELGDYLLGAASPGGITLDGQQQIWMISTKGTAASTFMNKWIVKGVKGSDPSLGYFEWSLPARLDPDDPASWWTFHPALGNTITEAALRAEMYADGVSRAERLRAYCNRLTIAEDPIIDAEAWKDLTCTDMPSPSEDTRIPIALEVSPGNALASIVAAWRDEHGRPFTRVVKQDKGTSWVLDWLKAAHAELPRLLLAADEAGPARRLVAAARAAGITVSALTAAERGAADMGWLAAARDEGALRHDGSEALAAGVAGAVTRTSNGVERISRDASAPAAAAVIASSVALWAYDNAPAPTERQLW